MEGGASHAKEDPDLEHDLLVSCPVLLTFDVFVIAFPTRV